MGSGWLRAPRQIRDRVLLLPGEGADSTQASLGKSRQRHRRFQGMRTAVGFVKMQPPCESPALAGVAAVAAADGALRRSPSPCELGREQMVPPWPWMWDLQALLTLRRKRRAAGGRGSGRVSGRVLRGPSGRGRRAWSPRSPSGEAEVVIWKLGRCRGPSPCAGLGRRGTREGGVQG